MRWFWNKPNKASLEDIWAAINRVEAAVLILTGVVNAAIKRYTCIICGVEFARLPHQSEKRCPGCQTKIKEVSGISAGNSGHRPAGHNTRGIHKPKV